MRAFAGLLAKLLRGSGDPLSGDTVVTLDAEMQSCNLKLTNHCSCSEAVAKIEDQLRGARADASRKSDERFQCRRNSPV
jgi:hypothetical protein